MTARHVVMANVLGGYDRVRPEVRYGTGSRIEREYQRRGQVGVGDDALQRRGVVDLAFEPGGTHIPDLWLAGFTGCDDAGGLHSSSVLLQ